MAKNIVMEDKLMITPEELRNVEFGKGLRGYKEDEVDAYLDKVIETVEDLLKEKLKLEKKIKSQEAVIEKQNKELEKYEGMKDTLTATLLKAEANAEETYELAKKKANEIKEEAAAECDKMIKAAEKKVDCIKAEYEDIKNKCTTFKNNYLEMLNKEIKDISSYAFEGVISNITEE